MEYQCSVCGGKIREGAAVYIKHTETHIIDEIKKRHPDWVEENGICPRCLDYYRTQLKGTEH